MVYTLKITVTAAHIVFFVFASSFLVTDPNNILCQRPYRLPNTPQLAKNCPVYSPMAWTA
jgi:hypothetical protein